MARVEPAQRAQGPEPRAQSPGLSLTRSGRVWQFAAMRTGEVARVVEAGYDLPSTPTPTPTPDPDPDPDPDPGPDPGPGPKAKPNPNYWPLLLTLTLP